MRMEGTEGFQISTLSLGSCPSNDSRTPKLEIPSSISYSLAAACSFWRDVLCSHSEFWTLVVLVDSKPTPLAEALLPEVVTTTPYRSVYELRPIIYPDLNQKCQIGAFLHILKSHLRRLFLVPKRPMYFPSPIPSTTIHLRPPLVYGSNPRPLPGFALLHPSPP